MSSLKDSLMRSDIPMLISTILFQAWVIILEVCANIRLTSTSSDVQDTDISVSFLW